MMIFDIAKLVDHFGGRSALHARLQAQGDTLSVRAIDKWIQRKAMPAKYLSILLRLAEDDTGKRLDLNQFLADAPKNSDKPLKGGRVASINSLLD